MPILKNKKLELGTILNGQRRKGTFCDVEIKCGTKLIRVHGAVLAGQSPYFADKLKKLPASDKGIRTIKYNRDEMEEHLLREVLDYMYGQSVKIADVNPAVRVMGIAKLFGLEELEGQIVTYLATLVERELPLVSVHCGVMFDTVYRLGMKKIRRNMVRFIAQQITAKKSYKAINTLELVNFRQILARVEWDAKIKCKSLYRFRAIASWVDAEKNVNANANDNANDDDNVNVNANADANANRDNRGRKNVKVNQDNNERRKKRRKTTQSRAQLAGRLLSEFVTLKDAAFNIRGMRDLDEMVAHELTKQNPDFEKRLKDKIKEVTDAALGGAKTTGDNAENVIILDDITNNTENEVGQAAMVGSTANTDWMASEAAGTAPHMDRGSNYASNEEPVILQEGMVVPGQQQPSSNTLKRERVEQQAAVTLPGPEQLRSNALEEEAGSHVGPELAPIYRLKEELREEVPSPIVGEKRKL